MRRFATTYRWELFLLFGLPVVLGLLRMATYTELFDGLARLVVGADYDCGRVSCAWWIGHGLRLVHAVLLGATYPFVRRQGSEFLTLLWGLETALQVVTLVVLGTEIAAGAGDPPRGFRLIDVPIEITRVTGPTSSSGATMSLISYNAVYALHLPVYLWFIRRASRISMGHAFLLYGLSMADAAFSVIPLVMIYVTLYPTLPYTGLVVFHVLVQVGLNVLMFQTLIRRDELSPASRMAMAAALIVAASLVGLLGWFLWWGVTVGPILMNTLRGHPVFSSGSTAVQALRSVTYLLPVLALGYFVRVRRPVDIERELDTTDEHQ